MPNIKDQSTVQAIAREYCSNGRNKCEAMRKVGYKDSYCDNRGTGIVYTNDRVIKAIRAIDEAGAAQGERTVQSIDSMQQAAYDLAMDHNQPSAAVSAAVAIARLYGMDKDTQANPDQPLPLTKADLDDLNRKANIALKTDNRQAG